MFTDQGGPLWAVVDVLLVVIFAMGLIYGLLMYRRRPRDRRTLERAREATRRLYRHEEAEAEARAVDRAAGRYAPRRSGAPKGPVGAGR